MLPFVAENLFGVHLLRRAVFLLRCHKFLADENRRHFVPPDAPVEDLSLAGLSVEVPLVTLLHERYGQRPVLRSQIQRRHAIRLFHETVHLLVFLGEIGSILLVLRGIPGRDDLLRVRSEKFQHRIFVVILRRRRPSLARFFCRLERRLARLLRPCSRSPCRQAASQQQRDRSYPHSPHSPPRRRFAPWLK